MNDIDLVIPLQETQKEQEAVCESDKTTFENLEEQYNGLKQERINLQDQIRQLVRQCNQVIHEENAAVKSLDELKSQKERNERDREEIFKMTANYVAVIKSYNEFLEINRKHIGRIKNEYDVLWREFEGKWMTWTFDDIFCWFMYKTMEMESNNVIWTKVGKELRKRNITGKSLQKFNELTFEFLGIHDFEVVQCLMDAIESLISQSTKMKDKVKTGDIPEKFICPITKKVMEDPVIAFDGHSYERKAIQEYLQEHHKSPVTGETTECNTLFPNIALRKEIMSKSNGSQIEGVAETT